ncbi:MAG TPA: M1 family aminopeptidase [Terracidiphilus sp.]|nr:M1 family aminopeptidase [Terracidiphilus sp.]
MVSIIVYSGGIVHGRELIGGKVSRRLHGGLGCLAGCILGGMAVLGPAAAGRAQSATAGTAATGVSAAQAGNPAQSAAPTPARTAVQRMRERDAVAALPDRAMMLRGAYGPFRANNDLLYYHLTVRVNPEQKSLSGKNTIRFRMLKDGKRIQIDLQEPLQVDKILMGTTPLHYERDSGAVFIDFPETLRAGQVVSIDFYYSGHPRTTGRFGGITFKNDPEGHTWINTACEGIGASLWWPDKDQWRDEVQDMDISVEIPNGLVDVSNGKFVGKTDLGDGYTRWDWHVHYPINNYDVSLNIGNYVHFGDHLGSLPLDFYVLPEDLEKAKVQFAQAKGMLEAYQHYFGPYPWQKDGYKLIEAPYSGMEHQSAVTYGNLFENGYLGRDWTGVGISPRFDFIIIHESAHEWFGNSITAADPADMWIHEAWATYLESLYVEYRWGTADAIRYLNGYKPKVRNLRPIVGERGVNADPPEDQYFKGALMINTLRSVVNNDAAWWKLLYGFYQHFKYQNILTGDVIAWFNQHTGMNLTPIFNQYLRHAQIPRLELLFGEAPGMVMYKWRADEEDFAMPVRVGTPGHWQTIRPTTHWQWMQSPLGRDEFQVDTDHFYVDVNKQ